MSDSDDNYMSTTENAIHNLPKNAFPYLVISHKSVNTFQDDRLSFLFYNTALINEDVLHVLEEQKKSIFCSKKRKQKLILGVPYPKFT